MRRFLFCLTVTLALGLCLAMPVCAEIIIDGVEYDDAVWQSGPGWTWSPDLNTLALNGFSGRGVNLNVSNTPTIATAGDNYVAGDIVASRLILSGTGVVEVSGEVDVAQDARFESGVLRIKGGFDSKSLDVTGGELSAYAVKSAQIKLTGGKVTAFVSTGGTLEISGGELESHGNMMLRQFVMSSGSVRPDKQSDGILSLSSDSVVITGGDIELKSNLYAIFSQRVFIGGTTNAVFSAGQSVFNMGTSAYERSVCGKDAPACTYLVIENGVITQIVKSVPAIQIGGTWIYTNELNTDFSGAGWRYDGAGKTLTLDGYDSYGSVIKINSNAVKLRLAPNSANSFFEVYFCEPGGVKLRNAVIDGDNSALDCHVRANGVTLTGVELLKPLGDDLDEFAHVNLTNSSVTAGILPVKRNISLKNSSLQAKHIKGAQTVTVNNSTISTGTLKAKKLVVKDSMMIYFAMWVKNKSFSGSLILNYDNAFREYYVERSTTLSRSFDTPEADYYVPERVTLTVKPGVSLRFNGPLVVDGTIVGDIASSLPAQSIEITGPDYVTSNQQITLKIKSSPASSVARVNWSCLEPSIATVSQDGVVRAGNVDAPQTVTIAAVSDDGLLKAQKEIAVLPAMTHVSILLDGAPVGEKAVLTLGDKRDYALTAVFEPSGAYSEVKWKSSKKGVARVQGADAATLRLKKKGKTKITCTTLEGLKATVEIQILPKGKNLDESPETKTVENVVIR